MKGTSPSIATGRQSPDFDVAELDGSAVILQPDVSLFRLAPVALSVGGGKELAGFHVSLPAVAVDVVYQELFAIPIIMSVNSPTKIFGIILFASHVERKNWKSMHCIMGT